MGTDYRVCKGLASFNSGSSVCLFDPGKVKAIILTIHGYKLPATLTRESLEKACHADRPGRIFPIKTIAEYAPSGGEAQTQTTGYGPTKITGYSAKSDTWTLEDYDVNLKANLASAKSVAFDAYFVDENNVIYGIDDGTSVLAGIPMSGVYPGGQDWDSSGTEANLTVTTLFKDYERYMKTAGIKECDFDVVDALRGLVYVDFMTVEAGKYKLVEHFGRLDITEYYGDLLVENSTAAMPGATAVTYSGGVISATGTPKLASPSVLQANGIVGIEAHGLPIR